MMSILLRQARGREDSSIRPSVLCGLLSQAFGASCHNPPSPQTKLGWRRQTAGQEGFVSTDIQNKQLRPWQGGEGGFDLGSEKCNHLKRLHLLSVISTEG